MQVGELDEITARALRGEPATTEQALDILKAGDDETMSVVAAAGRVRRHFFGTGVRLNYLVNLKSGLCSEDCAYCSQSLASTAQIPRYSWVEDGEVRRAVEAGVARGASTVCLVASGRGPSRREVDKVAGIVARIHREHPSLHICTCLGFLDDEKAKTLYEAGSDRYNHNLNTAESHYSDICSTHS